MESGVSILSKKILGQFLITSQPELFLEGEFFQKLRWNKEIFVPLQPELTHHLEINFPYITGQAARVNFSVALQSGERMRFRYNTPFLVTMSGKITRLK